MTHDLGETLKRWAPIALIGAALLWIAGSVL
jgi:hypothetical protein